MNLKWRIALSLLYRNTIRVLTNRAVKVNRVQLLEFV